MTRETPATPETPETPPRTDASSRMRLFVALMPPPAVAEQLDEATAVLRRERDDLRWTTSDQVHLTLVFLGDVGEHQVGALRHVLGPAVGGHPVLRLRLVGVGTFDDRSDAVRAIWAGVDGDREPLDRLAASLDAAARPFRETPEGRPYHAHVTLARPRRRLRTAAAQPLLTRLAPLETAPWSAERVHLVHSVPNPAGGRHEHTTIAEFPLTQGSGHPKDGSPA